MDGTKWIMAVKVLLAVAALVVPGGSLLLLALAAWNAFNKLHRRPALAEVRLPVARR